MPYPGSVSQTWFGFQRTVCVLAPGRDGDVPISQIGYVEIVPGGDILVNENDLY